MRRKNGIKITTACIVYAEAKDKEGTKGRAYCMTFKKILFPYTHIYIIYATVESR